MITSGLVLTGFSQDIGDVATGRVDRCGGHVDLTGQARGRAGDGPRGRA